MNTFAWIWQHPDWPHFTWDNDALINLLSSVSTKQGMLAGMLKTLGLEVQLDATLDNMAEDILRSSEIEGVLLNADRVRSSIARNLGLPTEGLPEPDHYTEGIVRVMLDALTHAQEPVTDELLFRWHAALFPLGRSGGYTITVAQWRQGPEPMQVVSGAMGKEKIHYVAPPSTDVPRQMRLFLDWINAETGLQPILKAAIAHLWLVVIHPFDDGNGRIARTLTDVLLARADGMPHRYYSMSAAILNNKKSYYAVLEQTSRGGLDITGWIRWFLATLDEALEISQQRIDHTVRKALFWQRHAGEPFNERQRKILNRLFDGIEGVMSTGKWAKMTHTSQPTAYRDIEELVARGILRKAAAGGRSTNYELNE